MSLPIDIVTWFGGAIYLDPHTYQDFRLSHTVAGCPTAAKNSAASGTQERVGAELPRVRTSLSIDIVT